MKKCIVCGAKFREIPLLELQNMPYGAQKIPGIEELEDDRGIDLKLYQCAGCGLVQFDCEPVDYYRDVIRAGGGTTTMMDLRKKEYESFIEMCHLKEKKIIEVGCGQGEFLEILAEFPVKAYGIEHKADLVEKAKAKGLRVTQNFAEKGNTIFADGPFDAFLSFNFLEHQPFPNEMLQCIYNNLTSDGYGLITVPSFEYILENDSFYELLRDHIANYTQDSLRFLVEKNGFSVLHCERINRDTWEMIVQKRPMMDVSGLIRNFAALTEQMKTFTEKRVRQGKKVAVWGASHQGFTAISTTGVQENISYIIDSAIFKQGKYAPASHVPIVSPEYFFEEPVESILIIAPGYSQEIAEIIRQRYGEKVEIAVLKSASIELLAQ